jgi:hypothetical protein
VSENDSYNEEREKIDYAAYQAGDGFAAGLWRAEERRNRLLRELGRKKCVSAIRTELAVVRG